MKTNRVIKFRVWDLDGPVMFDWESCRETKLLDDAFDGERAVAMQFTGLKDKNGKEIYEGDIVRIEFDASCMIFNGKEIMALPGEYTKRKTKTNIVEWSGRGFNNFDSVNIIGAMGNNTVKIIGNIFETPELLNLK